MGANREQSIHLQVMVVPLSASHGGQCDGWLSLSWCELVVFTQIKLNYVHVDGQMHVHVNLNQCV